MEVRPRTGFVSGVLGFLATYIIVFVLSIFLPTGQLEIPLGFELFHAIIYHAHNPLAITGVTESELLTLADSRLMAIVLLVPPVVLFSQAQELAEVGAPLSTTLQQSLSMVIGYTPLALMGALLLPELSTTLDVLFAAVVYPLLFGFLGGLYANLR